MNLKEFSGLETIFENNQTLIRKGKLEGNYYVLKNYKYTTVRAREGKILKEKEITARIHPNKIETIHHQGIPILIKPFVEGVSLAKFIENWKFDTTTFLKIALGLARQVAFIHLENVLHLDINPTNIIYNPTNQEIEVIDFGSANLFQHKSTYLGNPERVECDLHYISPEQTGRINRIVDFSTDLYACGAVLYELATGRKVFPTDNSLELVHNHIAKVPDNPYELNDRLLPQLGNIILKLLAKNSEERYQSNLGLIYDLEFCQKQFSTKNTIDNFLLGRNDVSDKFRLSQKTYGRITEIIKVENAFNRICQGKKEYVLISGKSGVGKSNLVAVTHKQLAKYSAIFIQGKFDQVNRHIPYFAWGQAFNNFIELLITENEDRIAYWKHRLEKNLGENLGYLSQIIPNLKWLFTNVDKEKVIFTPEIQTRFKFAIRNFIQCLATPEHPLVIFIDDWQWADNASLELLNNLVLDERMNCLLLINAFRGDEITDNHPFNASLELLHANDDTEKIHLNNLTKKNTLALLEDTLKAKGKEVNLLNDLIYDRTEGNALYYVQFLTALRDENLIQFDVIQRKWTWGIDAISRTIISDNIVELLIRKIKKYDKRAQKILQTAAVIGSSFSLEVLALASDLKENEVVQKLNQALVEGLIFADSNPNINQGRTAFLKQTYKFAHDRIQQGVYDMLSEADKIRNHLQIGKVIIEKWSDEHIEQHIFSVIGHLNKSISINEDDQLRNKTAALNLVASQKAKILVDYENALNYANQGIAIVENRRKGAAKRISLNLHLQRYELGHYLNQAAFLDEWEHAILDQKPDALSIATLMKIKINGLVAAGYLEKAIETGLPVLAEHGYSIPKKPVTQDIIDASIRTATSFNKNKIADLIQLPIITDPLTLELTEIFQAVNAAAYFYNQTLWALITIETTRFYIKNGLSTLCALTFISYGATLIIGSKDFKSGVAFGRLALAIYEKLQTTHQLNKSLFSYHTLISWWEIPLAETEEGLQLALDLSLASGDLSFVGHTTQLKGIIQMASNPNLQSAKQIVLQDIDLMAEKLDYYAPNSIRVNCQYLICLADPTNETGTVCGEVYDFEEKKAGHYENNQQSMLYNHYASAFRLNYLCKNDELAYENLMTAEEIGPELALYTFYFNLTFIVLIYETNYSTKEAATQKNIRKAVKEIVGIFEQCASVAPANFDNKYKLAQGALLAIKGKKAAALEKYQEAIESAQKYNFVLEEAMAWERSAAMLMDLGKTTIGKQYIQTAYDLFFQYGAYAVCTKYIKLYPWLKKAKALEKGQVSKGSGSSENALASLDLATVLKSSEALSGETDFEKLLRKLILIAIENAGAEKGYLLLKSNGQLKVNVYGDVDKKTEFFEDLSLNKFAQISKKVINYVAKTWQTLILADAANDAKFGTDTYLKNNQVKSIFSLPILNKGEFIGLLYLENNVTTNAFTQERVELLNLLSGQIAISIENALLIENLEEKVKERTLEIEQEKEKSDNLLLNILPKATAEELRLTGAAEPKFYEEVTVLFLDFKNFSGASRSLDYKELVSQIDEYFSAFDEVIGEYHVEKIKTIGDAYMCACGLPIERTDHAVLMTKAAIHFQKIIAELKQIKQAKDQHFFEARIGIHTGPVVAGVVGSKKFAYDIWGDTVNIASRMEYACAVGKIAISEQTFHLIKEEMNCEYQGKVPAKNMEELDMYYL